MNRYSHGLLALCFFAGLTACGGGYSGFVIPVESELKPWVAPEADEILPAEEGSDDEDYEDYEDEEEDEAVAPAATGASAEAAAPPAAKK